VYHRPRYPPAADTDDQAPIAHDPARPCRCRDHGRIVYRQPIYQGNLLKENAVEQLQVGMAKQQVAGLLGTPSIQDPYHPDRWDYTASERTDRLARTRIKNLTLWFDANDELVKWEGDYFPNQDAELAKNSVKQFGRNLAKEKKKR